NLSIVALCDFLGVNRTSLNNQKKRGSLSKDNADKLISFNRLAEISSQVFETDDEFILFLSMPNRSLNGKKPKEFLSTHAGMRVIENLLYKIRYSVYS
ncbi:MAG: MbcA/ParS/Xre antitoxin family protein, partial [Proteobacteria bacterium]|nr:MbcA/ParS/Xre antitoxin family protein [Pseudomonadota bacterium]